MTFKVGDQVRTPESMPVSYGHITNVYEGGRFYEVERVYGRKRWRRKYTREQLEAAALYEQKLKRGRAKRAARRRRESR